MPTFRTPALNRRKKTQKISIAGIASASAAAIAFSLVPGSASADTAVVTPAATAQPAAAVQQAPSLAQAHALTVAHAQAVAHAQVSAHAQTTAHAQAKAHAVAKANAAAKKKAAAKVAADKRAQAEAASRAAARTPVYANNLDGWIREALSIMKKNGIPGSYEGIHRNIMRESSGNPNAINNWDINAINGVPSIGLLQVIKPTFDAYHVAGTAKNQYDPVANIVAACNYAADRYGSMDNVDSAY
jgi:hypothetical protein